MQERERVRLFMCLSYVCICVYLSVCVCVHLFSIILFYKEASAHEWSWKLHSKCLACDCVWFIFIFFQKSEFKFSVFFLWWKMASLGNFLVTKILGHSAAEKAFRWGKKRFRILSLLLTFCHSLSCVHEFNWKLICN